MFSISRCFVTRLCQELDVFFFQNWSPWRVRALGRFFWIRLLILWLLSIGSLQLTERQGMRSVFHRLLWCWIINAALLVPVWSCGLVECLEYSPQNQFSLPFVKKNMRKLALSSDLGRWSVPDGHWCFCRGTNLSKHQICAVVVPLNCSEKCCEEIFQIIVFFTCCNFSILFTPSNINFHFWFLSLLQFLTFLWLPVFLVRKLRSHSSHESVTFKFLNVAWIQHLFKYSNEMLQCNEDYFSPSASQTSKFFYIVSRYLLIRSCTVQEVHK